MMCDCPFTEGQLLAVYAILHTHGDHKLAALVLEHARRHETTKGGGDDVVEAR